MPITFTAVDIGRREYARRFTLQAGDQVEVRVNGAVQLSVTVANDRRYNAVVQVAGTVEDTTA